MKDLKDFPRTRYRRAWIVINNWGQAVRVTSNGAVVSSRCGVGELFCVYKEAALVLREARKFLSNRGADKCHIQAIMVPLFVGPSEHFPKMPRLQRRWRLHE